MPKYLNVFVLCRFYKLFIFINVPVIQNRSFLRNQSRAFRASNFLVHAREAQIMSAILSRVKGPIEP